MTPGVGREFLAPQPCYEYSPVKARELLAQAGLTGGFDLDFWTPNGRYTKDREVGEAIQAMLGDVGIRARLQTFEWATYLQKWTAPDRMMWMIGRSASSVRRSTSTATGGTSAPSPQTYSLATSQ